MFLVGRILVHAHLISTNLIVSKFTSASEFDIVYEQYHISENLIFRMKH